MECLGCPAKLVAVVRSLYSQSTISIRLSMDGELAPSFVQKKGTRQGLNVGKTEVMGCRIKKAVVSEEVENAMKERVSVTVDGVEMGGWIVPAKWRAELGILEWSDDQAKGKMVIQSDNGDKWLVELRGSG